MEVNRCDKKMPILLLVLTFVFSYFEFFFRLNTIMLISYLGAFLLLLRSIGEFKRSRNIQLFLFGIFIVSVFQSINQGDVNNYTPITRTVILLVMYIIASYNSNSLLKSFLYMMIIIAAICIVIYILNYIPIVNNFLVNVIAPRCVSLGADKAYQEGGGINVIIFNFQYNYYFMSFNSIRNCGPFWEPGMYAVFLNLALYVNLFIIKKGKVVTLLFLISLISTLSTGGFAAGLFVLYSYLVLNRNKPIITILSFVIFVSALYFFSVTDFLGNKLNEQLMHAQIGSDISRFGAMLTQLKMIVDNPLLGYIGFKGYAIETDYLASGTLLPLVQFGIPLGLVYYYMMYKASRSFSIYYGKNIRTGNLLFFLILILSVSQTILLTSFFYIYTFCGVIIKRDLRNGTV